MSVYKDNVIARKEAEEAREEWVQEASLALRLARQCKGENVEEMTKTLASVAGRLSAEKRAKAKEAAAKAAQARRLACKTAMGPAPTPPLPRDMCNGGRIPVPPPIKFRGSDQ